MKMTWDSTTRARDRKQSESRRLTGLRCRRLHRAWTIVCDRGHFHYCNLQLIVYSQICRLELTLFLSNSHCTPMIFVGC